jgi:hypothetical protein
VARDPVEALHAIATIAGIQRVLSRCVLACPCCCVRATNLRLHLAGGASGGEATALDGAPALATLVRTVAACGYPLTIVAGGGVRARNARRIVEATGVRELHLSGRSSAPSPMVHRSGLTLNAAYGASDYTRTVADAHLLRACRAAAAADV